MKIVCSVCGKLVKPDETHGVDMRTNQYYCMEHAMQAAKKYFEEKENEKKEKTLG